MLPYFIPGKHKKPSTYFSIWRLFLTELIEQISANLEFSYVMTRLLVIMYMCLSIQPPTAARRCHIPSIKFDRNPRFLRFEPFFRILHMEYIWVIPRQRNQAQNSTPSDLVENWCTGSLYHIKKPILKGFPI